MQVRTIHVDDHPLFCLGLQASLRSDIEVIARAGDGRAAIELAYLTTFDVALVDVIMPELDGIAFTAALRAIQPDCKILGLSMIDEPVRIADMFRAGAGGYALKTQSPAEILDAIRAVLAGIRYLAPRLPRDEIDRLCRHDDHSVALLSARERQVFEELVRGRSNDEIASRLFVSRRTVETHRQRILKKLDVHSLAQLVRTALRHGYSVGDGREIT